MRIGEVAKQAGISTKTIRYYEAIELMPPPQRSVNGYREYLPEDVDRLIFIRDAQATGLTLTEIGSILDLRGRGEATCHHVTDLLRHHMKDLDRRIAQLLETRDHLQKLTDRASRLDPADCTDPVRCQTIGPLAASAAPPTTPHVHDAPARHRHGGG